MENAKNQIAFKGTADGLVIIIPGEMETKEILEQVALKVKAAEKFFRGAKLKVMYRGRKLTEEEEEMLVQMMVVNSGVSIESIRFDPEQPQPEREKPSKLSGMPIRKIFFKEIEEGPCKFIKGTVRGGTRILYEGNVVVLGDANPGSEIVASGNVVIMGTIRGMVHAGADGNRNAIVAALRLCPTQLRIADLITRCPETYEEDTFLPEIASIKDGVIYVEPLGK
ncbi:MAG: septum site-determining protein MinC [Clostridiaceae bacterium]|jgi:septum site-determining protein MinC|nr:septum site-determining protein MinC [Clostridiaceae bacterium]